MQLPHLAEVAIIPPCKSGCLDSSHLTNNMSINICEPGMVTFAWVLPCLDAVSANNWWSRPCLARESPMVTKSIFSGQLRKPRVTRADLPALLFFGVIGSQAPARNANSSSSKMKTGNIRRSMSVRISELEIDKRRGLVW